jgi:hypothetical protein
MFPDNLPKHGQIVSFTLSGNGYDSDATDQLELAVIGRRVFRDSKITGFTFHLTGGCSLYYHPGEEVEWRFDEPDDRSNPTVSDVSW